MCRKALRTLTKELRKLNIYSCKNYLINLPGSFLLSQRLPLPPSPNLLSSASCVLITSFALAYSLRSLEQRARAALVMWFAGKMSASYAFSNVPSLSLSKSIRSNSFCFSSSSRLSFSKMQRIVLEFFSKTAKMWIATWLAKQTRTLI